MLLYEKKKHHTVPRCYLASFVDKQGLLWVLDQDDKIFSAKPEGIMSEKNFYTVRFGSEGGSLVVEDTLANIEAMYADVFKRKISHKKDINKEERGVLAIFIASMMNRTKARRESLRKRFRDIDDWISEWETICKRDPEVAKALIRAPSGGSKLSHEQVKDILIDIDQLHSMSLVSNLPEVADILFQMRWAIIHPIEKDDKFLTSDNPFCMCRPEAIKRYGADALGSAPGLLCEDVEISLPLSSKKALIGGWRIQHEVYVGVQTKLVKQINIRSIMYARERVISSNREQLEVISKERVL